jgi:large subunit ribosomal protein L13
VIRGKHKPTYTPNFDVGDNVVVINAQKVRVTGRKLKEKEYLRFSGYPAGLKRTSLEVMLQTEPTEVIKRAVRRISRPYQASHPLRLYRNPALPPVRI